MNQLKVAEKAELSAVTEETVTVVMCRECYQKLMDKTGGPEICSLCGKTIPQRKHMFQNFKLILAGIQNRLSQVNTWASIFMAAMGFLVMVFSLVYAILERSNPVTSLSSVIIGLLLGTLFICLSKIVEAAEIYICRTKS